MKRMLAIVLILVCLSGCDAKGSGMDKALMLRDKMITGNGCRFSANITADYGDKIYSFVLACQWDVEGKLQFEIVSPDSISGICGIISGEGGSLTFDDQVLMFEMLADGQITPISSPWIFVKSLNSGYIRGCIETNEGLFLQIDDSYLEDAMQLDIRVNEQDVPVSVEIIWRNKRIISMEIEDFTFL